MIRETRKGSNAWEVRVYDPLTKTKRYVGTRVGVREARRLEAESKLAPASVETVAGYTERWLELHPRNRRSTMIHYTDRIRSFIADFGPRRLDRITRIEARVWALENRSAAQVVRAMYSDAIDDGLTRDNPFRGLRLEQSRGRKDLDVMTVEEIDQAVTIAGRRFGPHFAALVATAAYCGLRPGEMYALEWGDIDFENNEICVRGAYSSRSKETTRPKNDQQRRVVLFPKAATALQAIPERDGFVFRTITGKRFKGTDMFHYWDIVRTALGRDGESFYAMRHFCASWLLNDCGHEAEDVAYQLGHTDGGVLVRKLYGHPGEGLARERLKSGMGRKVVPVDFQMGRKVG